MKQARKRTKLGDTLSALVVASALVAPALQP